MNLLILLLLMALGLLGSGCAVTREVKVITTASDAKIKVLDISNTSVILCDKETCKAVEAR